MSAFFRNRRKSAWLEHTKAPKFTLVVYEHDLVNDKYEKTVTYHNIDIISSAARISRDTLFEEIRKRSHSRNGQSWTILTEHFD